MHRPNTFSLVKKQLDQTYIKKFIQVRHADKHSKGFDSYRHLLVMIFAQLAGIGSLRDLEFSLNSHHQHHYHLGLSTVRRSTLAYANQHRPIEVFTDLLASMNHRLGRKQRKEVNDLVFLLDSTSITLKGRGFDEWTKPTKTRCTQGLKVHIEYWPKRALTTFCKITESNVNDLSVAREMGLQANATYVFDKAYCDYDWWLKIDQSNSRFVTRLKNNAAIKVIETRPLNEEALSSRIIEDAVFCLTNKNPRAGRKLHYTKPLRRITIKRDDKDTPLVLVTNDFDSEALKISELYKNRWLVELFFKWIKQHLRIKRFMGHNKNAVQIQIITALIAYTLVATLHMLMPVYDTIREMLLMLRTRLFQAPSFEKPPPMRQRKPTTKQLKLGLLP